MSPANMMKMVAQTLSTPVAADPIVNLTDICKVHRLGNVTVKALSGVTLTIREDAFLAVTGPSGSGKSTLLNIIGCLDAPTSGVAEVCGVVPAAMSDNVRTDFRSREIGFVFQSYSLVPTLTAVQNVETGLPRGEARRRERALEALEEVGLADQARRRPREMSGGQQQRTAIARALVKRPSLVLADEPTANLDSHSAEIVLEVMMEMRRRFGTSFVFSTHDPRLVERMDQIVRLRDGKIISQEGRKS